MHTVDFVLTPGVSRMTSCDFLNHARSHSWAPKQQWVWPWFPPPPLFFFERERMNKCKRWFLFVTANIGTIRKNKTWLFMVGEVAAPVPTCRQESSVHEPSSVIRALDPVAPGISKGCSGWWSGVPCGTGVQTWLPVRAPRPLIYLCLSKKFWLSNIQVLNMCQIVLCFAFVFIHLIFVTFFRNINRKNSFLYFFSWK